jgi:hypothetical protein
LRRRLDESQPRAFDEAAMVAELLARLPVRDIKKRCLLYAPGAVVRRRAFLGRMSEWAPIRRAR